MSSALDDLLEGHKQAIEEHVERQQVELATSIEAEKNWERTTFIRETARQLYVGGRTTQPRDAWTHAKALWDAKPEDC